MTKHEYMIGERVVVNMNPNTKTVLNKTGTLMRKSGDQFAVLFDTYNEDYPGCNGDNCNKIQKGWGLWIYPDNMKPYTDLEKAIELLGSNGYDVVKRPEPVDEFVGICQYTEGQKIKFSTAICNNSKELINSYGKNSIYTLIKIINITTGEITWLK